MEQSTIWRQISIHKNHICKMLCLYTPKGVVEDTNILADSILIRKHQTRSNRNVLASIIIHASVCKCFYSTTTTQYFPFTLDGMGSARWKKFQNNSTQLFYPKKFNKRLNQEKHGCHWRVSPANIGIISPKENEKDSGTFHEAFNNLIFEVFLGRP